MIKEKKYAASKEKNMQRAKKKIIQRAKKKITNNKMPQRSGPKYGLLPNPDQNKFYLKRLKYI